MKASIHEVRVYQTEVLGTLREKITDPNHPMSADEITASIDDAGARMPGMVKAEMAEDNAAPSISAERSSNISVPNL